MLKSYWFGIVFIAIFIGGLVILPPLVSASDWLLFGVGLLLCAFWPVALFWLARFYLKSMKKGTK